MATISDLRNAYCWSITKLAEAFNLDRRTIRRRLDDAGVQPRARNGDQKLYALEDAGPALFTSAFYNSDHDPDTLDPQSRRAWYQSENERLKFEQDSRHLIPDHDVAREYSVLAKALANGLDSLPDELERECGLAPEVLERLIVKVDALRESIYTEASK